MDAVVSWNEYLPVVQLSNYMTALEAFKTGSKRYFLSTLKTAHPTSTFLVSNNLLVQVASKLTIAICVPPYAFREFSNVSTLKS